jgi:uncharacterized membrane protein (DUF2068 family)
VAAFKLVTATAEALAATVLLAFSTGHIERTVDRIVTKELRHDPNDLIANLVARHVRGVATDKTTLGITFAVVAAVKIVGAVGLLRRRPWGYYLLLALVVGAIPLDVYHLVTHHRWTSVILLLINIGLLGVLVRFKAFLTARESA